MSVPAFRFIGASTVFGTSGPDASSVITRRRQEILRYPPTQELTTPQRDLVWKFRFYLTRDKRALTKFLKSVVWSDPGEAKQAVETLLPMWHEVEMDDALELLGPAEGFRDRRVRAYAVRQLERADDEVRRYRARRVGLLKRALIMLWRLTR